MLAGEELIIGSMIVNIVDKVYKIVAVKYKPDVAIFFIIGNTSYTGIPPL